MISVVILTLNEAANLPRCLTSVSWSDDVLVVDSGSGDETLEIAKAFGARVIVRPFDTFAHQRNFAMEKGDILNPWVLHLDADEVVTDALRVELQEITANHQVEHAVFKIPSRLIFMDTWLRYSGMYPTYQVRFGRAESLRFIDYGHGQREVQSPESVGTLSAALDHYNFSKGINEWFVRHLGYAHREAAQALIGQREDFPWRNLLAHDPTTRRRAIKQISYRMPFRAILRFLYMYILRRGFLDGKAGFHYSIMVGIYQYFVTLNEIEQHYSSKPEP